ncbi:hypothetical protein F2Q70_00004349 [Brassica cretica]|uniref:Uncharacterized protein n=1 Tax=Brassica cretica TaxID=69181 RepID=A0A8S9IMR6_BRACR|nr:hypothetical protein F2Q70_00004349 [Brassica cretica]
MKPWSRDESLTLTLNIRSVSATDLYEYESQDKTMIGGDEFIKRRRRATFPHVIPFHNIIKAQRHLIDPTATATTAGLSPPPSRFFCILHHQGSSASSTFPYQKQTKIRFKERDKDRDRERYVEPWWSGGETASMTSNGETPKSNHAEER